MVGSFFESADGLPYIGLGRAMEHTYVATGYSGTGMTYGTAAAMLMSDLILDRENPWAKVFDPSRVKPVASMKRMLEGAGSTLKGLMGDRIFKVAEKDVATSSPTTARSFGSTGNVWRCIARTTAS